jgi:hypothetical protein
MKNLPSTKTIETRLGVSRAQAKAVRHILETVQDNPYKALEQADKILGTYGVEYVRSRQDSIWTPYGLEYLNTGDLYDPTLIFNHDSGRFCIAAPADFIERRGSFYV